MKQRFERNGEGTNIHHKIARQHGGSNVVENLEPMPIIQHRAHHILFGNDMPVKQMQSVFYRGASILRDEVIDEVEQVLSFWMKEGRDAYDPKAFKKKRHFES